jgi:hypothetical protein
MQCQWVGKERECKIGFDFEAFFLDLSGWGGRFNKIFRGLTIVLRHSELTLPLAGQKSCDSEATFRIGFS